MRVLFVAAPSQVDRRLVGHTGRRLPALFRHLGEIGVQIDLALLGDTSGRREAFAPAVASVRVLPALPPEASALVTLPAAVRRLRSAVRELRPELVAANEPMPTIAAGLATRGRKRPVLVYHRHHETGRRRLVTASRVAARLADLTAVESPALRDLSARDDRVSPDHVLIARNSTSDLRAVDEDEIGRARHDLGIAPEAPVVAVVSRLRAEKGIDVLLAAADRLRTAGAQLVIVGSGPEEEALRALAGQRRTPVHFVGHTNDVALWLNVADVVALPSRRDAFPRTAVEALAACRPIVGSRVGGLVDAVDDGVSGLLVPPEDPDALATALDRVLGDRELARSMGEAGRRRYEESYTTDAVADSWRSAWQTALANFSSSTENGKR